ncbi:MAG: hypothetical protein V7647_662 [Acidobacteriota bacterium]
MERARRQLRMIEAAAELAEARCRRMLSALADAASALRIEPAQDELDAHACRSATLLAAELMIQEKRDGAVALSPVVNSFATRMLIGSSCIRQMATLVQPIAVPAEMGRWMLMIVAELVDVAEASASPGDGVALNLVIDAVDEIGVVVRVAVCGGAARPVLRASGTQAYERALRIMELFGSLEREVDGANLVYSATFVGRVSEGDIR